MRVLIVKVSDDLKPYVSDYNINVFEIAWLRNKQVELFKSDFKIVADYFVQMRTNKDYKPSPQKIRHVHEVVQFMAIFTKDNSFEEFQNLYVKGEEITMTELLDKVEARGEARGEFNTLYKQIKKGILTVEQAANSIDKSVQELLDGFKEYNLVL